jgi:Fe-S cluster assembly protein SufD
MPTSSRRSRNGACPSQAGRDRDAPRRALRAGGGGRLGHEARNAAIARVRAEGLPTRRDEYWKYTDPASLTQDTALRAALFEPTGEAPLFSDIDRLKVVFVDGVFDPEQSDDLSLEGVRSNAFAMP